MKKFNVLMVLMLFTIPCLSQTWTQKADWGGTPRAKVAAFVIGTNAYLATGEEEDGTKKKDLWQWNSITDQWVQKADMTGAERQNAVGFSIGNLGYIATGNLKQDMWEFNPSTNTWTQKADYAGGARNYSMGFAIGTKAYLGGGSGSGYFANKDFYEYDQASNVWTKKADLPNTINPTYGRRNSIGFSIGNKGYMGFGSVWNDEGEYCYAKDLWEYDTSANTWTRKADFPGIHKFSLNCASNGVFALISLGTDTLNSIPQNDVWAYYGATNTWVQKTSFTGPLRYTSVSFAVGNRFYIAMGHKDSDWYKDLWELNLNNNPTNVTLSHDTISEKMPVNTFIGKLITTDPDILDHFTYSLVSGTGSDDNASFTISGDSLFTNQVFNYWTKHDFLIRVRTTDQDNGNFEKTFTIKINNTSSINEISDELNINIYPNPAVHLLNIEITGNTAQNELCVFDIKGNELIRVKITEPIAVIDLSKFTEGIYYLYVKGSAASCVSKFVKR